MSTISGAVAVDHGQRRACLRRFRRFGVVRGQRSAHGAATVAAKSPVCHVARLPICHIDQRRHPMRLTARNQLAGTVAEIEPGAVMTIVKVRLTGGQEVTASVTKESVSDLGLAVGSPVTAVIKSTEVMLGVEN
jgi:molybdate transport system regulatory protein